MILYFSLLNNSLSKTDINKRFLAPKTGGTCRPGDSEIFMMAEKPEVVLVDFLAIMYNVV